MGSIGSAELLIFGFVGLVGIAAVGAGVVIYALTRKQR